MLGGETSIISMLDQAKYQRLFKDSMQISRLRDRLKIINKTPNLNIESDNIFELDNKILQSIKYYR